MTRFLMSGKQQKKLSGDFVDILIPGFLPFPSFLNYRTNKLYVIAANGQGIPNLITLIIQFAILRCYVDSIATACRFLWLRAIPLIQGE
jgi:hypothetical protein